MSVTSKQEVLEEVRPRYCKATRVEKKAILDEFCRLMGMHRKAAIRLLRVRINEWAAKPLKVKGKRGRRPIYKGDIALLKALRKVWGETEFMCSKNLKRAMREWLPAIERTDGAFPEDIRAKLLRMSAATIDRLLDPVRAKLGRGRCGTKPGAMLRTEIPLRAELWDVNMPGYMEADTVAHCGGSMAGMFIWSMTATDIHTQWTEVRAMFHKGAEAALEAIKAIEKALPFALLAFDSDNGGEFINQHLVRYFALRDHCVYFTRSREYHKNDNAHVEQKNYTHVRQLLGYQRLDNVEILDPLNRILEEWSTLRNHFYPVRKLLSRCRIGSRNCKSYDEPRTPYERMLACSSVSQETKDRLKQIHESLDPVVLRRSIRRRLKQLLRYASVTPNFEASIPQTVASR